MNTDAPRPEAPERHITIAFEGARKGNPGPGGYAAILVIQTHEPRRSCTVVTLRRRTNRMGLSGHRSPERTTAWSLRHDDRRRCFLERIFSTLRRAMLKAGVDLEP